MYLWDGGFGLQKVPGLINLALLFAKRTNRL